MIAHLRELGYADAPDYEKLRGIFRAMLLPAERPAAGAVAEVDWAAEGLARGGKKTRWRDKGRGGAGGPRVARLAPDAVDPSVVAAAAAAGAAARAKPKERVTVDEVVVRGSKRTAEALVQMVLEDEPQVRGRCTLNGAIARPSAAAAAAAAATAAAAILLV